MFRGELNEDAIKLITEEITKSDVKSIFNDEMSKKLSSKELENKIKEISTKVIEELYKILWTRRNFWMDSIKK